MIGDKAKADDAPEVYTQQNVIGVYQLETLEEVHCDEITEEGTFPKFGEFVKCREVSQEDGVAVTADEICYVSWYTDLDRQLTQIDVDLGTVWRINGCYRNADGDYVLNVEEVEETAG